jgi:hypothetical protein
VTDLLTDKNVSRAIEDRLFDMNRHLSALLNSSDPTDMGRILNRTEWLAGALAGQEGYTAGQNVAEGLLKLLVPQAEQRERGFWETSLGRAIAWWTGGQGSTARRRMIAEAVSGVSRQAVGKMIADGHLVIGPGDDVTADSLRAMLQRRYPHEVTA